MAQTRVFVPQDAVEAWLTEGRAEFAQDMLTLDGHVFRVSAAVRFVAEVTGGADAARLVGRVKSRQQLVALSAEHTAQCVVLGDNAYDVIEGYLLSPQLAAVTSDLLPLLQKLFVAS